MADYPQAARQNLITLPHHVEFLSDGWLDEVRRFLAQQMPVKKPLLAGPFSVSERFTDAPPHLGFPDDVATWSLRFDGESVTVSREFVETADLVLESDYQAALSLAQFVGVLVPGGAEEMWREAHHMFGADAFRVRGALANEQAERLIALAHDHMARRTVENPDLEHRARKLGLTGHIREMQAQGFTVIERAISGEFADSVRAAILRSVMPEQGVTMNWMLYQGREFERLTLHPKMLALVDASFSRKACGIGRASAAIRVNG